MGHRRMDRLYLGWCGDGIRYKDETQTLQYREFGSTRIKFRRIRMSTITNQSKSNLIFVW